MLHRVFIAINLPPKVKKILASYQKRIQDSFSSLKNSGEFAKWVKPDNFHITLEFLGNVNDQEIEEICRFSKKAALKNEPFDLLLNNISFGPLESYEEERRTPKFIWVRGELSPELNRLFRDLDNLIFVQKKTLKVGSENLAEKEDGLSHFTPHVTLARLRQWQFRRIDPEERPQIEEELNLSFGVDSFEVMESQLKKKGPIYTVLESINLGSPSL